MHEDAQCTMYSTLSEAGPRDAYNRLSGCTEFWTQSFFVAAAVNVNEMFFFSLGPREWNSRYGARRRGRPARSHAPTAAANGGSDADGSHGRLRWTALCPWAWCDDGTTDGPHADASAAADAAGGGTARAAGDGKPHLRGQSGLDGGVAGAERSHAHRREGGARRCPPRCRRTLQGEERAIFYRRVVVFHDAFFDDSLKADGQACYEK